MLDWPQVGRHRGSLRLHEHERLDGSRQSSRRKDEGRLARYRRKGLVYHETGTNFCSGNLFREWDEIQFWKIT